MSIKNLSTRMEPYDQPGPLMLKTIELVKARTPIKVFAETGISFYWLKKFVGMEYKNPSVNRVEYLYEYLTNTKLLDQ